MTGLRPLRDSSVPFGWDSGFLEGRPYAERTTDDHAFSFGSAFLRPYGILFAGIVGFIDSDLMVPPPIAVNAEYYGWRRAPYIGGIMSVSIVATALILDCTLPPVRKTGTRHRSL